MPEDKKPEEKPEPKTPFVYKPKDDTVLKAIAVGIKEGRVWTSNHCRDVDELRMSFMILALMEKDDLGELIAGGVHTFFEWMDKAGPRSINGLPCFFSCDYLNKEDWEKVKATHDALVKAEDSVKVEGKAS